MFLTAVDGQKLKSTTEAFDRFLPYAVALGVEQAWAKQFSGMLAVAGAAQAPNYSPSWYKGALVATTPLAFASSFDSGFSNAISGSYSRPPGSSSGVGAGGFSGGGFSGGVGGGGGW